MSHLCIGDDLNTQGFWEACPRDSASGNSGSPDIFTAQNRLIHCISLTWRQCLDINKFNRRGKQREYALHERYWQGCLVSWWRPGEDLHFRHYALKCLLTYWFFSMTNMDIILPTGQLCQHELRKFTQVANGSWSSLGGKVDVVALEAGECKYWCPGQHQRGLKKMLRKKLETRMT